jgi:hypothetical protein
VQLQQKSMVTNNNYGIVFTIFGRRGKEEGERGGEERDATTRKKKGKTNMRQGRDTCRRVGSGQNSCFCQKHEGK